MIIVTVFALLVQQATAQAPTDTNPTRTSKDTTRLSSIFIREPARRAHPYGSSWSATALKVGTPLRDTPLSLAVVTKASIRDQSMLSMADALRYVPGVTMGQGEGHRDAPTIRGNSSTADFFVDGVRDDAQYFRDLYNVERVEALGGANAMTFGRGGGGGVINRVTKRAQFASVRDLTIEGGAFGHGRGTMDVGGALGSRLAARLNGLYQHSGNFRDAFVNTRVGVSPQASVAITPATTAHFGAEFFSDERTVDRGLPSFQGRPSAAPLSLFFGNPDSSYSEARVLGADAIIEHIVSDRAALRSQFRFTRYNKFYQNVYPRSAVDSSGSTVSLAAYNNDAYRSNVFSQNELALRLPAGRFPQTFLVGVELGRQATDNVRLTGYFNGASTSLSVPFQAPTVTTPVEFRPSASDANNYVLANVVSVYAQDQLWLTRKLQATLGVRVERFDLNYRNNRAPQKLTRRDNMVSPRAGLVFKPVETLSLYSSLSVSHLPSSGDQFAALTPTTQALEPERFTNREVGFKWTVRPTLSLNAALYQLDRTNSAAPSALDPGVYVLTGRQRTTGYEVSLNGQVLQNWDVVGMFASQSAEIVSRTLAASEGAIVPLVPRHSASLWNRVQVLRAFGLGLGTLYQSDVFAAIDNTVKLPGFWRFDGAVYVTALRHATVQVNVENLFDRTYYATSHGNNNIMPGAPRLVRVSLTTKLP
ncbi:MAG: TonB-dependent receptor [Gemmatimonadaceae bacterium]